MINRKYICEQTGETVEITSLNEVDHTNAVAQYESYFDVTLIELQD